MVTLGRATCVPHNNSKECSGSLVAVYKELRRSTKIVPSNYRYNYLKSYLEAENL